MKRHRWTALLLALASPWLSGCVFIPALLGAATTNATWPTQKATGDSPLVSGKPLTVGFTSQTGCDAPFVTGGTEVFLEGEQLCLRRRELVETDSETYVSAPGPALEGALLEIVTEQGRSENISLTRVPATYLTQCPTGVRRANVWAAERKACVKNTVLTSETRTVTVKEIINLSWVPVVEWTVSTPGA